jgi:uncharacterized protein (UPF0333 family)
MMDRKRKRKFGKNKTGQVTLEYFILLTILAVLTLLSVSTFFSGIRGRVSNFTQDANNDMLDARDSI